MEWHLFDIKSPEDYVKAFVAAAVASGRVPVIVIDEANLAFPTGENAFSKREASKALATFVAQSRSARSA